MPANFTAKDVIDYLDRCIIEKPLLFFMDLQHSYTYTATRISHFTRMTPGRSSSRRTVTKTEKIPLCLS